MTSSLSGKFQRSALWRALRQMAAWLLGLGIADAAVENTGVYWWPTYHALAAGRIGVCVRNAAHMRNVPGRKTDLRDCQWIAELHEHGLQRPSFIPAAEVAALREVSTLPGDCHQVSSQERVPACELP